MADSDRYAFLYFYQHKNDGTIYFDNEKDIDNRLILPRHPETNELDKYYLQSMLKCFDDTCDFRSNEILDAFPVLSLTTNVNDKFYKLSIARLQEFSSGRVKEDEYILMSIKHLFMKDQIARKDEGDTLLDDCLEKLNPIMYKRSAVDTVNCEGYDLSRIASYVPTSNYRRMKLLKGWIEGALHYYEYSILFFDVRFVGYDDFNENIVDIKSVELILGSYLYLETKGPFILHDSGLYYDMFCRIDSLNRNWLITSPNNDNERDGKVMLFRNEVLRTRLEESVQWIFKTGTFRINEVLKWNRYADGGKFNDHFDTMFVNRASEECSLYTLLVYIEVERDDNILFLGEDDLKVALKSNRAYIIPHWVKHRVNGTGLREFIKAEIIFKNKHVGITYDQSIADAFDQSCYYMLQSVRHPQLKDFVSRSFNAINEARFYKTKFLPVLTDRIFLLKNITVPLKYECYTKIVIAALTEDLEVSYITDGKYYYFKCKKKANITPDEAFMMLSMMYLDIHPKRMFSLKKSSCDVTDLCSHEPYLDEYKRKRLNVTESVFYWQDPDIEKNIDRCLSTIQFPSNMGEIISVANISVSDIKYNAKTTFHFAAYCASEGIPPKCLARFVDIAASGGNGNYDALDISFVGKDKKIVKIRQSSFGNGVRVENTWKQITYDEFFYHQQDHEESDDDFSSPEGSESSVDEQFDSNVDEGLNVGSYRPVTGD